MNRHVVTSLLYLITYMYLWINIFYVVFFKSEAEITSFESKDTWWAYIFKILMACQGFTIPIARLSEPYFYEIVATSVKKWWNETFKSKK